MKHVATTIYLEIGMRDFRVTFTPDVPDSAVYVEELVIDVSKSRPWRRYTGNLFPTLVEKAREILASSLDATLDATVDPAINPKDEARKAMEHLERKVSALEGELDRAKGRLLSVDRRCIESAAKWARRVEERLMAARRERDLLRIRVGPTSESV